MSIKQHLINHTQKHQKKYLFWIGTLFGIIVFKIALMIGGFLGTITLTQKNSTDTGKLSMYKKADVFHTAIYDMLDILNTTKEKGNIYNLTGFKYLDDMHKDFHNTEDIYTRFEIIEELQKFFEEKDAYLHEVGAFTTPEDIEKDKKYHQTISTFNSME